MADERPQPVALRSPNSYDFEWKGGNYPPPPSFEWMEAERDDKPTDLQDVFDELIDELLLDPADWPEGLAEMFSSGIDVEPAPLTRAMIKAACGYLRNRSPGVMAVHPTYAVIGTGDFPGGRRTAPYDGVE